MGKRGQGAAAPASDSAAVDTDGKTKKAKLSAIADAAVDTVASSVGSGKLLPVTRVKIPALGPSPAAWFSCPVKKLQKPVLPAPDADRVGRDVMKEVIPYVLQELPTFLKLDRSVGCLTRRAPVQINPSKEDKQKRQMTNYKEAWVLENCPVSIKQSKMYEAGGNALWLNPECWDENFLIPGPELQI